MAEKKKDTKQNCEAPETVTDEQTETATKESNQAEQAVSEMVQLTADEFNQVKAHIEELQIAHDAAAAANQRSQADFANFKRRNATIAADSFLEGKIGVISRLLPVLDDFDRALECACADAAYSDGIKLVQRRLFDELTKLGLKEIPTDGKFDPNFHEAVMQEPSDMERGSILLVLRKGYTVDNRIIRHSMVKVAQ